MPVLPTWCWQQCESRQHKSVTLKLAIRCDAEAVTHFSAVALCWLGRRGPQAKLAHLPVGLAKPQPGWAPHHMHGGIVTVLPAITPVHRLCTFAAPTLQLNKRILDLLTSCRVLSSSRRWSDGTVAAVGALVATPCAQARHRLCGGRSRSRASPPRARQAQRST